MQSEWTDANTINCVCRLHSSFYLFPSFILWVAPPSISLYLPRHTLNLIKSALFPSLLYVYYCHRLKWCIDIYFWLFTWDDSKCETFPNRNRNQQKDFKRTNWNMWILQLKWNSNCFKKCVLKFHHFNNNNSNNSRQHQHRSGAVADALHHKIYLLSLFLYRVFFFFIISFLFSGENGKIGMKKKNIKSYNYFPFPFNQSG